MSLQGVKFEPNSFKLNHEMVVLMGGRASQGYALFVQLTVKAFLAIRPHAEQLVQTVALMLGTGFPSFKGEPTIKRLRDRFALHLTERQAADYMVGVVKNAHENMRSTVYDEFQRLQNGAYHSPCPNYLCIDTRHQAYLTHSPYLPDHDIRFRTFASISEFYLVNYLPPLNWTLTVDYPYFVHIEPSLDSGHREDRLRLVDRAFFHELGYDFLPLCLRAISVVEGDVWIEVLFCSDCGIPSLFPEVGLVLFQCRVVQSTKWTFGIPGNQLHEYTLEVTSASAHLVKIDRERLG